MSTKRVLAIDLGASGGKAFVGVFNDKKFEMEEIYRFEHEGVSFHTPGKDGKLIERTYWNDISIYSHIIESLSEYRRKVGKKIDSIGIDTWGADGLFISESGEQLGKFYCYRDHRLDNMIDALKQKIDAEQLYKQTGIVFQPFNLSSQLLWAAENRPDLFASGNKFLPTPSLFYHYLGADHKVDSTWASVTQLAEAGKLKWSKDVLNALGIPEHIFPEIVKPGSQIGSLSKPLANMLRLNRARLTAVASHDTASAFAAAPVAKQSEAMIISSGTWALVGKLVAKPITSPDALAANLSNEGGIGNTRLLTNCMGGWLVHELRRVWRIADGKDMDWPEIYKLAEEAPAFKAFIDPDDSSFYNPSNMEEAMSEFCKKTGQKMPETRGGILRMVYESLALKYRHISEMASKMSGQETKVLHIVGGGSRNELLNQFAANALGVPVLAGPVEATAVGNIMVQALGLGIIKSMRGAMPMIKQAFPINEYQPGEINKWNTAYAQFKKIISK